MSVDHDIVMTRQKIYMWKYDKQIFCSFLSPIPASSVQVCLKRPFSHERFNIAGRLIFKFTLILIVFFAYTPYSKKQAPNFGSNFVKS